MLLLMDETTKDPNYNNQNDRLTVCLQHGKKVSLSSASTFIQSHTQYQQS